MGHDTASLKTDSTFSIGELAELLDISTRTIRYYEERGLINPARTDGGQRIYTRRDRGRLKLILRAKLAGLDLAESKEVLDLYDITPSAKVQEAQAEKLAKMVDRRVAELDNKIAEMTQLRESLIAYLANLRQKSYGAD